MLIPPDVNLISRMVGTVKHQNLRTCMSFLIITFPHRGIKPSQMQAMTNGKKLQVLICISKEKFEVFNK